MESLSDKETSALVNAAYKREWAPNPEGVTLSCASAAGQGDAEVERN